MSMEKIFTIKQTNAVTTASTYSGKMDIGFEFAAGGCIINMKGVTSQVILGSRGLFDTSVMQKDSSSVHEHQNGVNIYEVYSDDTSSMRVERSIQLDDQHKRISINMTVKNISNHEISVDEIRPFSLSHTVEGIGSGDKVYINGRNMCHKQLVHTLGSNADYSAYDYIENITEIQIKKNEDGTSIYSNMFTVVGSDPQPIIIGFVSQKEFMNIVKVYMNKGEDKILGIFAVCETENYLLKPGETLESEELTVFAGENFYSGICTYADQVAEYNQARKKFECPSVWCDWYHYYRNSSTAEILKNVEAIKALGLPVQYIQTDAAYQKIYGNWLNHNEDAFPGGMKVLADGIKRLGYKPGIWLAPFVAEKDSKLYREHPDWVVTDENGDPCSFLGRIPWWKREAYLIDFTRPEVIEWFSNVIRTVTQEQGYQYLKLDFLSFATEFKNAKYFKKNMTRVSHLRKGLESIREAAGEDVCILGCTSDFGPTIGIVDGMRVSGDIEGSEGRIRSNYWRTRQSAELSMMRGFMHKRYFYNDPDSILVRQYDSEHTDEEVMYHAMSVMVSGGTVGPGDDMSRLSPDRVSLLKEVYNMPRNSGVPLDLMDGPIAEVYEYKTSTGNDVVAVFNHKDQPVNKKIDMSKVQSEREGKVLIKNMLPHSVKIISL